VIYVQILKGVKWENMFHFTNGHSKDAQETLAAVRLQYPKNSYRIWTS
jgi:hypothetical protein